MTGMFGAATVAYAAADAAEIDGAAGPAAQGERRGAVGDDQPRLQSMTLDELAEELHQMGLEVHIAPADAPDSQDPDSQDPEPQDSDGEEPADWPEVDPFEGMTDAEIDALSDEEFFAILDKAGIDYEDLEDGDFDDEDTAEGDEWSDEDYPEDPEPDASVKVTGDRIETGDLSAGLAERVYEIWQRFAQLIPSDQRQMVVGFELLPSSYEGAHVYPTDDDPNKWILGVAEGLGADLDYVLVHEFAHLLTLQAKEVPPGDGDESCPTYFTGEGCALKGSTMAEFVQRFWPKELLDEHRELADAEDEAGLEEFYQRNKDRFVSDYAVSNPAEDLAETFAVFVTEERRTGDTIADQKLELLWNDPDMVALRDRIRANL